MKAYIRGISALSPQRSFRNNRIPDEPVVTDNNRFRCIEPTYTDYLNPVMARRMGRIIKMGVAAAAEALKDANVEMPGAITAGSALGCLGDTEKFLTSVIRDDEQFLTPTHFIQSLQNTVSAQIALQLKCNNHNFTFVHKGFSFESAVLDAIMMLDENETDDILVGGLDEMTDHNHLIYNRLGIWRDQMATSAALYKHPAKGTIAGEGAAFFVIGTKPGSHDYGILKEVKTFFSPTTDELKASIDQILISHQIRKEEMVMLWGMNGDVSNDSVYRVLIDQFPGMASGAFKHWCGEYQTSSAFALWLGAVILFENRMHQNTLIAGECPDQINSVLICNNYENNFSLSLLTKK
jgi:hypothetical protein